MESNYYAIIPASVRYDKELIPMSRLLFGEITALTNDKGYCWATNFYFSELYGVSETSISKWIKSLSDKKYIRIEYIKRGFEVIQRKIYLTDQLTFINQSDEEKLNRSDEEKLKENTIVNNISNITYDTKNTNPKTTRNKNVFIPPTIEEVEQYFYEKGYIKDAARKAYEFYSCADWIDSRGNKVKNWKQKMNGVWFKDDNRIKKSTQEIKSAVLRMPSIPNYIDMPDRCPECGELSYKDKVCSNCGYKE
ncbi:MAG: helix-turn-helix domain-containing protein [Erysipelotrichaceae bacterium]